MIDWMPLSIGLGNASLSTSRVQECRDQILDNLELKRERFVKKRRINDLQVDVADIVRDLRMKSMMSRKMMAHVQCIINELSVDRGNEWL